MTIKSNPEKEYPWAERRVWRILRQNLSRALELAVASCKNPKQKQKTNTFLVRKVTHARLGGS